MTIIRKDHIYSGKAKTIYSTSDDNCYIMLFRDDTSAFNRKKLAKLSQKGSVNNRFNAFIMERLATAAIPTHFVRLISDTESLVKKLDMVPVECVVRNIAAGSLCRRLGISQGRELPFPLFEFFYKNDDLDDPMVNDHHLLCFGWATEEEIKKMKQLSLQINDILRPLFQDAGLLLVDYKLEFGRYEGALLLGDEFTPDGCRIWDVATHKSLDKDRFRNDLGDVVEAYQEVAKRLGVVALNA